MSNPSPNILVCGAIGPRLHRLEGALIRILDRFPEGALRRITLGYRSGDDLLVLVLDPGPSAPPDFGAAAAAASALPGLRLLDLTTTIPPDRLKERALRNCDPILEVDVPADAVARLRKAIGDPATQLANEQRIPVRFRGPDAFLNAYQQDLIAGNLFVPWEGKKPAVGASVTLEIFVPGDEAPIKALAKVIHHDDLHGAGFGARVALVDLARSRLELAVQRLRSNESAKEIRHDPRIPVRLGVSFTSGSDVARTWTRDISRGGVFIATDKPPPMGAAVDLTLELPGGEALRLPAEVVRVVGVEEAAARRRQPGCGLTFHELAPETRARLEAFVDRAEIAPKARVLLVDDAALFRRLLGDELASRGCHVSEATNGVEAFDKLVDELFGLDLLILDLVLPNTSGLELLDRIRRLGGETELAIAVVAGSGGDPSVQRRVIAAGADEVIPKSLSASEIADRLMALLQARSLSS